MQLITTAETKKCICMWCHCHCEVIVHIENGKLVKMEANPEHPMAAAFAPVVKSCPRAMAGEQWLHHTDRLRYPLKRAGERGQNQWQRIGWEQALDEIAAKLGEIRQRYGAEAIATSSGTGRTHDEYRCRFFSLLGSPNQIGQGHICWGLGNMISSAVVGFPVNMLATRPDATRCVLLIGTNPAQGDRRPWYPILAAKNAGAKLIVVDPRRTEAAERADIWLQVRPGTDCALLMSMIDVTIQEKLYDREFVEKWCHGFDKLAERAREYPPEKAAAITWVPADTIRQAARMYAGNKPAVCRHHMGLEHQANSVEAVQARLVLAAINGNLDVVGGDLLRGLPTEYVSEAEIELSDKVTPEQKAKTLGADRFRFLSWPGYDLIQQDVARVWGKKLCRSYHCFAHAPTVFRAMATGKPYPVKAMLTAGSNPMVTTPNSRLVYRALKNLDLYVVTDYFATPSAELADYLLPAASWLERPVLWSIFDTVPWIEGGEEAFSPIKEGEYERRTDFDLWRGLGIRMGQQRDWPWKTLEESYDYRLAPWGYTFKEFMTKKGGLYIPPPQFKKYERTGFATPTGKVELYSTVFEKLGYDPLPRFYEIGESLGGNPSLARDYPLVLITGGRFQPFYHSEWRQVEAARKQHQDPVVQIHPQTARELGINEGDWAWIETPRGKIKQRCQLFDGISPRVVHAEHGWWFPELPGEEPQLHGVWQSNINVVVDDDPDHCNRITGGWPLRGGLCKVYKVEEHKR